MHIELKFRGVNTNHFLYSHVLKRIEQSLKHVRDNVQNVVVRLSDVNGPKGGIDKRCQIVVDGGPLGAAAVEERHMSLFAAIDLAASRVARAVKRSIERRRQRVRRPRLEY
jgi:putative sigma-54 modulation protein